MTIKITKVSDDLYPATLILPDMPAVKEAWSTNEALTGLQLTNELVARGCHHVDIGDAMYEQDPLWVEKLQKV